MKNLNIKTIDNSLQIYGGLITFAILGYTVFNIQNTTNLLIFVLFLPIAIYFFIRIFKSIIRYIHQLINIERPYHPYFDEFSLTSFFSQNDSGFIITVFLISVATFIYLFKVSAYLIK